VVGDQIEQLDELITAEGDGSAFFEKTYITQGMQDLLSEGIARLAGASSGNLLKIKDWGIDKSLQSYDSDTSKPAAPLPSMRNSVGFLLWGQYWNTLSHHSPPEAGARRLRDAVSANH
jgi:hypothetical protein